MRTLKALIVINGLGTGGAERSLAEMLPGLVDSGITPLVACLFQRAEGVEQGVLGSGYDVRFLSDGQGSSRLGAFRRRARWLRDLIDLERPDLVHTTHFESDVAGRLAARGRSPVLTSLVNTYYAPVRRKDPSVRPSRLWAARMLDGWTARHLTAHFHAITHAVKEACVAAMRIEPSRVTVIERGRDGRRLGRLSQERRRRARAALGIAEEQEVVLAVGRREYQKGHRYLLEAIERLLPERPELLLLLAGRDGEMSADLERLRQGSEAPDRIRVLGHRGDVPELLAAADLFVLPSLYEGLGGVLIEAMALELPIVASDLPATREVVEEYGNALLVPPGSPLVLAQKMVELLDDPVRRQAFGARGRELFEERFLLERSVERMTELYRTVAAGVPPTNERAARKIPA